LDDRKIVQIKERLDKKILRNCPKLKFMKIKGLEIDYDEKNIEKPKSKVKVTKFEHYGERSLHLPKHVREKSHNNVCPKLLSHPYPHQDISLLPADKLMNDKLQISPGVHHQRVNYLKKLFLAKNSHF
jgi:hypothetical protein